MAGVTVWGRRCVYERMFEFLGFICLSVTGLFGLGGMPRTNGLRLQNSRDHPGQCDVLDILQCG